MDFDDRGREVTPRPHLRTVEDLLAEIDKVYVFTADDDLAQMVLTWVGEFPYSEISPADKALLEIYIRFIHVNKELFVQDRLCKYNLSQNLIFA